MIWPQLVWCDAAVAGRSDCNPKESRETEEGMPRWRRLQISARTPGQKSVHWCHATIDPHTRYVPRAAHRRVRPPSQRCRAEAQADPVGKRTQARWWGECWATGSRPKRRTRRGHHVSWAAIRRCKGGKSRRWASGWSECPWSWQLENSGNESTFRIASAADASRPQAAASTCRDGKCQCGVVRS